MGKKAVVNTIKEKFILIETGYCEKYTLTSEQLMDELNKYNLDNYYIYKATRKQKPSSIEDLKDFKYASFILFKKDKVNIKDINYWINWITKEFNGIMYLNKPFPPKQIINRIIIK